ncbi:MAG: hypothetical protein IJQ68_10405 [Methanobrevibacter sp.]|uniref:hypothetical protein n=1 Tax=Methanobrevibacter sp. TaxID=66852 RepID=UPI0025DC515D|nr:hypothetical protein [Methanobrevibacter sp.]MBR0272378.1 hypothetical protein [Methanobrevibacter sp.]
MSITIKELLDNFDLHLKLPDHILELEFDENYNKFSKKYDPDSQDEYYEFISDDKKYMISLSSPSEDGMLYHFALLNGVSGPGKGYRYNDKLAIAIELS